MPVSSRLHGEIDGAKGIYRDFSTLAPHHPVVERALADLNAGRVPDPIIRSAKDGAAEVLYGPRGSGELRG